MSATNEFIIDTIDRLEALFAEREGIAEVVKGIMEDAKNAGLDTKALRAVIQLRKLSAGEVEDRDALLAIYRKAVGV